MVSCFLARFGLCSLGNRLRNRSRYQKTVGRDSDDLHAFIPSRLRAFFIYSPFLPEANLTYSCPALPGRWQGSHTLASLASLSLPTSTHKNCSTPPAPTYVLHASKRSPDDALIHTLPTSSLLHHLDTAFQIGPTRLERFRRLRAHSGYTTNPATLEKGTPHVKVQFIVVSPSVVLPAKFKFQNRVPNNHHFFSPPPPLPIPQIISNTQHTSELVSHDNDQMPLLFLGRL